MLLPEVSRAFDRLAHVLGDISDGSSKSRPIRIHIPPSLLQQIVLPMIRDFHTEHPDIEIDILSSNVTGFPDMDTDMAIVFDQPSIDDRVTDLLWMVRVAPMCSPQTAAEHVGKSLQAFLADSYPLHVKLEGERRGLLWSLFARKCGIAIDLERGLYFDTASLAVGYAMTSDGVALADIDMFAPELAAGRLVMPFDNTIEDGFGYYLKLRPEDLSNPAIDLFRSWLINRFSNFPRYQPERLLS